jgi:MraZ protein
LFRGNFQHLVDPKGRVSVPAPFREMIVQSGTQAVMIARSPLHPPRSLECYPFPVWQTLEEKLLKLNRFDPDVRKLETFFFGLSHRCEIDGPGRVLLPPALRAWAGITKDVVFSGAADRFRIFDLAAWQQAQSDAESAFRSQPELLARMNF